MARLGDSFITWIADNADGSLAVEVIDAEGRFIGGIIAPGLETSAAALFSHATKLPAIDLVDPGAAIGTNTVHAMQAGIVYGEADRVDGFVTRVFAEMGYEAPVVATGGLATTMPRRSSRRSSRRRQTPCRSTTPSRRWP